jgi:hypothetical protein
MRAVYFIVFMRKLFFFKPHVSALHFWSPHEVTVPFIVLMEAAVPFWYESSSFFQGIMRPYTFMRQVSSSS